MAQTKTGDWWERERQRFLKRIFICLVLVLGVLRVFFRSTRAVLALAGALAVGCAWTFAWARLAIGELNLGRRSGPSSSCKLH